MYVRVPIESLADDDPIEMADMYHEIHDKPDNAAWDIVVRYGTIAMLILEATTTADDFSVSQARDVIREELDDYINDYVDRFVKQYEHDNNLWTWGNHEDLNVSNAYSEFFGKGLSAGVGLLSMSNVSFYGTGVAR